MIDRVVHLSARYDLFLRNGVRRSDSTLHEYRRKKSYSGAKKQAGFLALLESRSAGE